VRKNETFDLSGVAAPTKDGYEFLGWSTSKTGTATYGAEGSVKVASNMTLYAVWEKHLTVTLMDGDTVLHTSEVRKNDTYELSETRAPEKEGYEFLGWSTSRTGTASIQQEGSVKVTSNLTLYAVWGKLIAITFVNGDDSETSYYKAGENVDLQRLYREGYTFLGWGPKGSDSTFSSLKASKDMELYPKWLKDQAESKAVAEPASTGSFMGDNLGYTAIAVGAIVAGMVSVLLVFQMRRN
jgi:uncharacterized repeat protein (TIGR02543 family)